MSQGGDWFERLKRFKSRAGGRVGWEWKDESKKKDRKEEKKEGREKHKGKGIYGEK